MNVGGGSNGEHIIVYMNGKAATRFYATIDFNKKTVYWYNYNHSIAEYAKLDVKTVESKYEDVVWTEHHIELTVPTIFTTWHSENYLNWYITNQPNVSDKNNELYIHGSVYYVDYHTTSPEKDGIICIDNTTTSDSSTRTTFTAELYLYSTSNKATYYWLKINYPDAIS